SPPMHVGVSTTHCAWHLVPLTPRGTHLAASSHLVGHAPGLSSAMLVSHNSPSSSTPLPQRGCVAGVPPVPSGSLPRPPLPFGAPPPPPPPLTGDVISCAGGSISLWS